jgi:hypothetical protein
MNVMSDSWLRVVVDGKTQFEGVLAKGNNRTWEGQKNLKVRLGNAGGVILTYNDQLIGPIGKPGQVAEKEFNR